jgi:hypothetical protein
MARDDTWSTVLRRPGWVKGSDDVLETPPDDPTPRQYAYSPGRTGHTLSDFLLLQRRLLCWNNEARHCRKPYYVQVSVDEARLRALHGGRVSSRTGTVT